MKATAEECKSLNFYDRLPIDAKVEIDDILVEKFGDDFLVQQQENATLLEVVYAMTPDRAIELTKYADDYMYFSVLNLYEHIQPIFQDLFENTNYFKEYPECLI